MEELNQKQNEGETAAEISAQEPSQSIAAAAEAEPSQSVAEAVEAEYAQSGAEAVEAEYAQSDAEVTEQAQPSETADTEYLTEAADDEESPEAGADESTGADEFQTEAQEPAQGIEEAPEEAAAQQNESSEGEAQQEKILSSATSDFGNEVKKLLSAREEAQKDRSRLEKEARQFEKSYTGMQKSISDSIAVASKKKKEEIAATYDKELSQYQDQLESCKMERAKAKANAMAQKIQVENAPLNQQNQELEAQIEMKFKDNKVPALCKKRGFSIMFFPKRWQDWLIDAAAAVALLFFVPLLLILAMSKNPLALACVLFIYTGLLFAAYMYILHNYMLKFTHVNDEVEELRKIIRANNKTKQTTANRIRKSQDDTGYNLGDYDDRLSDLQKTMRDTVAKRQDALENFENEIRQQISEDISAANKDELSSLQQQSEAKQKELADKASELSGIEAQLREKYESAFGKEWTGKQKASAFEPLADFCIEHPELSLEEAAAQYRLQKK